MCRSHAGRFPSPIIRQDTQTKSCSPHICTKQCPHHHESRHQLLLLASSLICFSGPCKGNPFKAPKGLQSPTDGPFSGFGPVLQLLLADMALPTNTPHQQVQGSGTDEHTDEHVGSLTLEEWEQRKVNHSDDLQEKSVWD